MILPQTELSFLDPGLLARVCAFFSTAKFSKFIGNVACEGASPHTSIQLLPERWKILSASLGVSVCVCATASDLDQSGTFWNWINWTHFVNARNSTVA